MNRILVMCALAAVAISGGAFIVMCGQGKTHVPSAAEYEHIKLAAGTSGFIIGTAPSCHQDTVQLASKVRAFIDSFDLTPSQTKEVGSLLAKGAGVALGFAVQAPTEKDICDKNENLMSMIIKGLE